MGHMVVAYLVFRETTKLFSSVATAFYIPTSRCMSDQFSASSPEFGGVTIFHCSCSNRCVQGCPCGFN